MENTLTIFNFNGADVRTVIVNGEPWWVARDVCEVLEIKEAHRAVAGLDEDEKGGHIVTTPGGNQGVTIVNESGLYRLIFKSRKKEAVVFRKWVTGVVLPSIRKTGAYVAPGAAAPSLTDELRPIMEMLAQNLLHLTGKSDYVERVANEAAEMASTAMRDLKEAQERMAVMQATLEDRDLDRRQTLRGAVESIKAQVFKEMTARGVGVAKVAHDFWHEVKARSGVSSVKVENLTVSAAQRLYAEAIRQAQIWGVSVSAPMPLDFETVA